MSMGLITQLAKPPGLIHAAVCKPTALQLEALDPLMLSLSVADPWVSRYLRKESSSCWFSFSARRMLTQPYVAHIVSAPGLRPAADSVAMHADPWVTSP